MEDEEFKLSKSNKILIVITTLLVIALIVTSIFLIVSFSHPIEPLPNLEITQGKTSTINPKTTTSKTTTSTTTTTKPITNSPYYNINPDGILANPLFEKATLTKEESLTIITEAYEFMNKFMNISDDSLFNITSIINNAKPNEIDKITINGKSYGQMYKYSEFKNRVFAMNYEIMFKRSQYDNHKVFTEKDGQLYRLENIIDNVEIITASINAENYGTTNIEGTIRYYLSNYKDQGYSAPVYKEAKLTLIYDSGRWKIGSYDFPLYSR